MCLVGREALLNQSINQSRIFSSMSGVFAITVTGDQYLGLEKRSLNGYQTDSVNGMLAVLVGRRVAVVKRVSCCCC